MLRRAERDGLNVGVRLPPTWMVLDVDPRNFPEGRDPLAHLLAEEERAELPDKDTPHPSLAGAWLVLLQDCRQHMPTVALRLLI